MAPPPQLLTTTSIFLDEPASIEPIKVSLRLRPINPLEQSRRSHDCVTINSNTVSITSPLLGSHDFSYDRVYSSQATQEEVYEGSVAPLAEAVLDGFNCALVTYGQTGSGKTYTMMGSESNSKPLSSSITSNTAAKTDKSGMIPRIIKDIFNQMANSPSSVEYILRCSFVEIYLEKILDLLNPTNKSITISEGGCGLLGGTSGSGGSEGIQFAGASSACCFTESDVLSLLVRGNACRSVSSTKMNTDSSRSHAIFLMRIEQKDGSTGIEKSSVLMMIDMAGSELGRSNGEGGMAALKDKAIYQEARMINQSLSCLNSVVNALVARRNGDDIHVPHNSSKLTKILRDAIGGNCRTSVVLTASPASYNIDETIRTCKFGMNVGQVQNAVKPSVEMSPLDYRKLLNDSQKKQGELIELVNELSAECFQLKQDAKNKNFVESKYDGPLWETVEAILVNGAAPLVGRRTREGSDVEALREELAAARAEVDEANKTREHLENLLAERQSEVAVLRTQNDNYSSEKKKNYQELITARSEIRILNQRKQEVEHNLRTSQFREYEATVFLRQFRRFYRRLLRNKAAQGTGGTSDVIEKVPGVPDLNDLIDVDSLLLESGLIEESELHDDTATGAYRPSASALGRSTEASSKAWKEAANLGKVEELTALDRESFENRRRTGSSQQADSAAAENSEAAAGNMDGADAGAGSSKMPYGQTITNRQQFLGTPAGRLTTMRERELERDLLRATERCIQLQVALNEEKANVDILTNRAGNLNKKKFAQESIQLKQQLEKKTHDLQAIIWKMNELHLINKTYNEKMSNREQHVTYLEENLVELQSSNRNMIMERQEAENKLREELESLKVLVDAMTVPLWQFGECGVTGRTLASRIRLPIQGGEYVEENGLKNDGDESMESLEESAASEEEDEEDEMEESTVAEPEPKKQAEKSTPAPPTPQAPLPVQQVQIIQQNNVPMRDASTQTVYLLQEKGTMTDTPVVPPAPPQRRPSTYKSAVQSKEAQTTTTDTTQQEDHASATSSQATPSTSQHDTVAKSVPPPTAKIDKESAPPPPSTPEDLFRGGKISSSQPRRSVQKFGLMIRPGVLKESTSKTKDSRTKS